MKRIAIIRILPLAVLLCLSLSCERENGGIDPGSDTTGNVGGDEVVGDGLFSVSEVTKVEFAPGNLKAGGYGFTAHQYDYGGLFGWGTGNRPNVTDVEAAYTDFCDWGNYISGGLWYTLSTTEWDYLLFRREDAPLKYGMATVWGVPGIVLLPDKWVLPSGCTFRPGYDWRNNVYDQDQWEKMEKGGAVFLPAAGSRWGTMTSFVGECGYYWTSTNYGPQSAKADYFCFSDYYLGIEGSRRAMGCSVRLVKEKEY